MTETTSGTPDGAAGQTKLVLDTPDRDLARSVAGALQDLIDPPPHALTLFEQGPSEQGAGNWRIEAYYEDAPDGAALAQALTEMLGREVPTLVAAEVPNLNWVAISQSALPPVVAGRFTVHGSHDRGRVPRGPNAILIDAGEAFGTAHHATTYGCLTAIDRLTRHAAFEDVLDLGCGSGVLAIAVARMLPRARIIATDLDRQSVKVAAANMRDNSVGARITAIEAAGLSHPRLRGHHRFDLVIANILAEPLIRLSRDISRAIKPCGTLVLSGLLTPQAPQVIAAYRACGFALERHDRITGWSTLTLVRR